MRNPLSRRRSSLFATSLWVSSALLLGGGPAMVAAGPVPGVETFTKRAVEFPTPPSVTVWDIGNNEYLVTFEWIPGEPVQRPGVAGTFNSWSRTDLPMEGPDEAGAYRVTARLKSGDYQYKFVEGDSGWHADPRNPEMSPSDGNSMLRIGISALLRGATAAVGDGKIEMRAVQHDPASPTDYDLYSANDVLIRLRTLRGDVQHVEMELVKDEDNAATKVMHREASDELYDFWEAHLMRPVAAPPAMRYRFVVVDGDQRVAVEGEYPLSFEAKHPFSTPDWAKDAVWYQIMIDRFRDGDPANNPEHHAKDVKASMITHPWRSAWYTEQPWEREGTLADGTTPRSFWKWAMYDRLYGGDFAGVEQKLDYLKDLGVTAIYFNPVFESDNSHKYNARSYVHIDDGYGVPSEYAKSVAKENLLDASTWEFNKSDQAALRFIAEAKKRDLRVIFDGVFNHLGVKAESFQDVVINRQASPFADWYDVKSWEPFEYTGWAGHDALPQFRKDQVKGLASDSLREHIYAVTRRWMDPNGDGDPSDGIDGWRLDVPGDVPLPFWQLWRKVVKDTNPDAYIVGEIWSPAEQWLDGSAFDAVMNYQFSEAAFRFFGNKKDKTTASTFDNELARLRLRYPRAATMVLQNLYDSHDTDRWASRLMNPDMHYDSGNRKQDDGQNYNEAKPDAEAWARLRLMALFQSTYLGAPMIWYGTEVGMYSADDPACRQPMWWDDMMPYEAPESRIDTGLREEFRALFHLRGQEEALRRGDYRTLLAADAQDCVAFVRWMPGEGHAIVVVLNNSDTGQTITIPRDPDGEALGRGFAEVAVIHGAATMTPPTDKEAITLKVPPISGAVLRVAR